MNTMDYLKVLPVAHGIFKMLEQQDELITYGKLWAALGLGPWRANYSSKCIGNILDMLDAIDSRAHGKRVLHLYRIRVASTGLCGDGVTYLNRITRRRMTEAEAYDHHVDGNSQMAWVRDRNPEWLALPPDPVDPNCASGEA